MRAITALALAGALLAGQAADADARVTPKDLQVATRSLAFVRSAKPGGVKIGIVYDPALPGSVAEAQAALAEMSPTVKAGDRVLTPVLLKITELDGASDLAAFFLTAGLGSAASAVAVVAKANSLPCVTTDIAQVQGGNCLIGIRTDTKVEISINKALLDAGGIQIDEAFRMLIKEI